MRTILIIVCFLLLHAAPVWADKRSDIRTLFEQDMSRIDFARVKIAVDRMVDPSLNEADQLAKINAMASAISQMVPDDADDWAKVEAIRRYIYEPGPWNAGQTFSYDHDDPYGDDVRNKLLSDYLEDRRGNCITMPFLFIILAQRLDLDVAPALAPLHVFVKFTDETGREWNLETTSGALPARDQHYRDHLPITDAAVANGVYLRALTNEEAVAVIAAVVVEDLIADRQYLEAMMIGEDLIEHHPRFVYMMVKRGTAAYYLLRDQFYAHYPTRNDVPRDQLPFLNYLELQNAGMFNQAEALGWQPMER